MSTADLLLESMRKKSNVFQTFGSTVRAVGAVCLVGVALATLFTGGAAAPPLGVAGGVCTGEDAGVSLITMLAEYLFPSATMKEAKCAEKCNKLTKKIQILYVHDLDDHIMSKIMGAMARWSGWSFPNQPVFMSQRQTHTFYRQLSEIDPILLVGICGVLAFFSLKAIGKGTQLLFAKGGQLLKKVTKTEEKTALKGGAMVADGAIGLEFALPEAINRWKDLVKGNNETKASRSLRDTDDDLEKINCTLKKLDRIVQQHRQMLKDFEEFKCCIKNSNRTEEEKWKFIEFAKTICKDHPGVEQWLYKNFNTAIFFKLIDLFYFLVEELEKQEYKIDRGNIVDIVFVAHGRIEEPSVTASALLPLPSIEDVILYSPWNCAIDSTVAYGIAAGSLEPGHRAFSCDKRCNCPANHEPVFLPDDWNSMRSAGNSRIPNILVSPLKRPEDPAWTEFLFLQQRPRLQSGKKRVVIPYTIPMEVSFYEVTLALSLVAYAFRFKATVHLAACLGRSSGDIPIGQDGYLNLQYSVTEDLSMMTSTDELVCSYMKLYNMLRDIFDR